MSTAKPPITDSPWFWACLFASAGLFVLWYFSNQYEARQLRLERQDQARVRAVEIAATGKAQTEVSEPGRLRLPLKPIFMLLGALLIFAWTMLWFRHFRPQRSALREGVAQDSGTEKNSGTETFST